MTRRKAGYLGKGPSSSNVSSTGVWTTDQSRVQVAIDNWPGLANDDPLASQVFLAVEADVANVATFTDVSGRSQIITTIGNTVSTSAQRKTGNGSIAFDGTGDSLAVAHSPDLHLSSDFCVDFYFKVSTNTKGYQGLFAKAHDTGDARGIIFITETNNRLYLYAGNNGTWNVAIDTGFTPIINKWHHAAVIRKDDQWCVFVDGILVGNSRNTFAPSVGSQNQPFFIGRYGNFSTSNDLSGWIDRFRVTNGSDRYLTGFTAPTAAFPDSAPSDPYFANVSLLLHMNGVDGSATFTDSSSNNLTTTPRGGLALSNFRSKFGTTSGRFIRSSSQSLDVALGTNLFNYYLSDFTIEAWINLATYPAGSGYSSAYWILGAGTLNSSTGLDFYVNPTQLMFSVANDATATVVGYHGFLLDTWYHVAVTRNSNAFYMFVNGECIGAGYSTSSAAVPVNAICIGGPEPTGGSGSATFDGFIDEVRITKGIARYTCNFTPPSRYIKSIPAKTGDPYYASTVLQLGMEGTNGSTIFTNSAPNALTITASGNAQISTVQSRVGVSSAYFDGNGDYLTVQSDVGTGLGNGDFTVEAWIRPAAPIGGGSTNDRTIFGSMASTPNSLFFLTNDLNKPAHWDGTAQRTANTAIATDTWSHVVWMRVNGVLRIYINGVLDYSNAMTTTLPVATFYIGGTPANSRFMNGYIDNLRITKGVARYDANFTPQTTTYTEVFRPSTDPYAQNVALLLRGKGKHLSPMARDFSIHRHGIGFNGTPAVDARFKKFNDHSLFFNGSSSEYYVSSISSALSFGSYAGDFTVEFWINPLAWNGTSVWIVSQTSNGTYSPFLLHFAGNSTLLQLYSSSTGTTWDISSALNIGTILRHRWTHVSLSRKGSYMAVYIDGIVGSIVNIGTTAFMATTNPFIIGGPNCCSSFLIGCLDDMRVTKGISRYFNGLTFTPSTTAFTDPVVTLSEPFANKVQLLLHMASNGVPQSTLDSSQNSFTPRFQGNSYIRQDQSKFGNSSLYVDGTSGYLEIGWDSPFTIGISDFTIETWIYSEVTPNGHVFISDQYTGGTNSITFAIALGDNVFGGSNATNISFGYYTGSAWNWIRSTATVTINTWTNITVIRKNGCLAIFKDGTLVGGGAFAYTLPTGDYLWIGRRWDGSGTPFWKGYLDELRLTIGAARYGTFTAPTQQFTSDANTTLLLRMNGLNNSTDFQDSSPNNYPVTVNGNTKITNTQSYFDGTSAYFDGTGDWLSVNMTGPFDFGTGDFTVEMWVYPLAYGGTTVGPSLFGTTNGTGTGYSLNLGQDINSMRIISNASGSWADNLTVATGGGPALNTWSHIAWVRKGETMIIFKNGAIVAMGTTFASFNFTNPSNLGIIGRFNEGTNIREFNGYIDELRVSKGVARYNVDFTPTTAPFSDPVITLSEKFADKTTLLMHMNGSNGSTTFTDSSPSQVAITPVGSAQISTAQSKFDGSSLLLNGTTDHLTLASGAAFALGATSFTIEMWVRLTSIPSSFYFIDARNASQTGTWALLYTSGSLDWYNASAETLRTWTPVVNTWYHVAIVRMYNTCQFFVDGVPIGTPFTDTANYTVSPTTSYLGCRYSLDSRFPGYIDELRVTTAPRYPEPFSIPTSAHPIP